MANCAQIETLLDAWMDDALTGAELAELDAHCAECPACAAKARATQALRDMFSETAPELDVPLEAQAAWRGAVKAEADRARRRTWTRWAGGIAAALLVALGSFFALRPNAADVKKMEAATTGAAQNVAVVEADGMEALETAAESAEAYDMDADSAESCEMEAEDYDEAVNENAAPAQGQKSLAAASGVAYRANAAPVAPAHERRMTVQDLDRTCAYMADLISEYEGSLDEQRFEADGAKCANLFIDIPAENAADFLKAAAHYDTGDAPDETDAGGFGAGRVSLLLVLTEKE